MSIQRIFRQDVVQLWGPLDQRLGVSGELGDDCSVPEALAVHEGHIEEEFEAMHPILLTYAADDGFEGRMTRALADGNRQLIGLLQACQERQQSEVEIRRLEAAEALPDYQLRLAAAIGALARNGLFRPQQADELVARLTDNKGEPTIADAPVSLLEYHRLNEAYGGSTPDGRIIPYTDFKRGVIVSPLGDDDLENKLQVNKPHEATHAWISGVELMSAEDERTVASPQSIGLWRWEVVDGREVVHGLAANEGMTSLIEEELLSIDPLLAKARLGDHAYSNWMKSLISLRSTHPSLFHVVFNAYVAEPLPDDPDRKTKAFAYLDEQLDSAHDLPDNVKQLF